MEYGTIVKIKDRPELPIPFVYAGAKALVRPKFQDESFYAGLENFLCLEIREAADAELIGKIIYLHVSQVEQAQ